MSLPPNGKLLALIIYADKTKLSLFGMAMGYPVIARIGNLQVDIQSRKGLGSSELVRWLPIVTTYEQKGS